TEVDEETGEEVRRSILVGFRSIPVFAVEDTEGEPLPEVDYRPKDLPPLMEVAERLGVTVDYAPKPEGGAWGWFDPTTQRIVLYTHDVKTFFHELAHAAHAKIEPLVPGQDPRQEIIAETVALVLCRLYGYEGWERHG